MNLQPVADMPGAWINPRWKPDTPGTFAVIIGVSRYAHLDGSERSLWLDQLQVSALTAYRVFEWLQSEYYIEGCPVARCSLLLSATPEETRVEPRLADHALLPTFQNCEDAIGWWAQYMEDLPKKAAEGSRGLFFFSGHGFEAIRGNQLLLPSDYLKPPNRNPDRALSTRNLRDALGPSGVPLQLFLLDACRNAPDLANPIAGTPVLPDRGINKTHPDYAAPVLYATNAGHQAFQHPAPDRGISLFGRALLDGLAGKPDIALREAAPFRLVHVWPLHEFTRKRVAKQLEEAGAVSPQPVRIGGDVVTDALVTQLPLQPADHAQAGRVDRGTTPTPPPPPPAPATDRGFDGMVYLASEAEQRATRNLTRDASPKTREIAEQMSMEDLRLVEIAGSHVRDASALGVHRIEHDRHRQYWRIELFIKDGDPLGHCLELRERSGKVWTAVLPVMRGEGFTSYQLELEFEGALDTPRRRLVELRASLGAETIGPIALSRDLWRVYTYAGYERTLAALKALARDEARLHEAPDAAVLAGCLALRLGDVNLADRFRKVSSTRDAWQDPDWAVLKAASTLWPSKAAVKLAPVLAFELLETGFPWTTEAALVAGQLVLGMLGRPDRLDANRVSLLRRLGPEFSAMADALVGRGLFATFVDMTADDVAPRMAWNYRARVPPPEAVPAEAFPAEPIEELYLAVEAAPEPGPAPAGPMFDGFVFDKKDMKKKKDDDEADAPTVAKS